MFIKMLKALPTEGWYEHRERVVKEVNAKSKEGDKPKVAVETETYHVRGATERGKLNLCRRLKRETEILACEV